MGTGGHQEIFGAGAVNQQLQKDSGDNQKAAQQENHGFGAAVGQPERNDRGQKYSRGRRCSSQIR
jgi:hypothetical protein